MGDLPPPRDCSAARHPPAAGRRPSVVSAAPPGHPAADDRMVEALLASVHCPCTAEQLARALDWTLQQTTDALGRLQARLVNTGQTLQQTGHHTYTLAPRPRTVCKYPIGRRVRPRPDWKNGA